MPQGGIDKGEEPWATARSRARGGNRHRSASRRAHCPMPGAAKIRTARGTAGQALGRQIVGQDQDWYLARFLGSDSDVNIATKHPEFREWKWIDPQQIPDLIVPFKRDLYRQLLREFRGSSLSRSEIANPPPTMAPKIGPMNGSGTAMTAPIAAAIAVRLAIGFSSIRLLLRVYSSIIQHVRDQEEAQIAYCGGVAFRQSPR